MTTATVQAPVVKQSRRRTRLLVCLSAAAAATVVYLIAVTALGVDVQVPESPGSTVKDTLPVAAVVMMGLLSSFAGWAALAVLERLTAKAVTIWTVLALVVLAGSLPYMPGYTVGERLVLGAMHLSLGAVLIVGLRRTATT